jgi:RimJ/RimL family protein N-acetyltransferase
LNDDTPLFDIKLQSSHRGKGTGERAVKWMVGYVFQNYPNLIRMEGYTRKDNYAMRTVFHKCGFVKESYHRKGWGSDDGQVFDAIGYGILKEDWENSRITPIDWDDFKY